VQCESREGEVSGVCRQTIAIWIGIDNQSGFMTKIVIYDIKYEALVIFSYLK
jgi:hypothetical protein